MNFKEFFALLTALFSKEDCCIKPNDNNFSLFLACRYISFIDPELCVLINETSNKYHIAQLRESPQEAFSFLKSLLPKMEIGYIEYIKKNCTEVVNNNGISNDIISEIASNMELPEIDVLKLVEFLFNNKKKGRGETMSPSP